MPIAVTSASVVSFERARRVAEHVARELVEQQHERERGAGLATPVAEAAAQGALDGRTETRGNQRVEGGILAKPFGADRTGMRAEPEFEDLAGEGRHVLCYSRVDRVGNDPR